MTSVITELALRSAVNTTPRDLTGENQAAVIQGAAMQQAKSQINASTDVTSIASQVNLQAMAIGVAVTFIAGGFIAASNHLKELNRGRIAFEEEQKAGHTTFVVPCNKELRDLSVEEQMIKDFVDFTNESPSFASYLGLHSSKLKENKNIEFHAVLPYWLMSERLPKPVASLKPVDRERLRIDLFFSSDVKKIIRTIQISFQTDNTFVQFFVSAWERKNYLNNRRAPLFIMVSLCNLLWNLMHPVDPKDGYQLSRAACIEKCREVELYLNKLLDKDSPHYLGRLFPIEKRLKSFLLKVEVYVKSLREAYTSEQLHELKIDEVITSSSKTLRIMDTCVFELIYREYNPLTKKMQPDEKAAEHLAHLVSYLQALIKQNGDLISQFRPVPDWIPDSAQMNQPPQTVIDVLIIFCHATRKQRELLLQKIRQSEMGSATEFAQTLGEFLNKFVLPVRAVCKRECAAAGKRGGVVINRSQPAPNRFGRFGQWFQGLFEHNLSFSERVGQLTASRLMPLITLVIEDYRIEVDTPAIYLKAKHSNSSLSDKKIISGKEQVQSINDAAQKNAKENEADGYYKWALSPFVNVSKQVAAELDKLPEYQYHMTKMTKLMDNVGELVENYRSLLQHESFKAFLLKCMNKVKGAYKELDERIANIDNYLSHDENLSRGMQSILRPMIGNLISNLDAFSTAAGNFERVVAAPDFIDQQRQLLSLKLTAIHDQFETLFAEESGIRDLIDEPAVVVSSEPPPVVVDASKVIALRKVVQRCFDALSYLSREGHKGALLRDLLSMIDRRTHYTEEHIKRYILELTHVVVSYRQTWFFQADYGQTRSAKALMDAIRDPCVNEVIPLAKIILNAPDINYRAVSDKDIVMCVRRLREDNRWQESVEQIGVVASI